jgi:hypothetical protein
MLLLLLLVVSRPWPWLGSCAGALKNDVSLQYTHHTRESFACTSISIMSLQKVLSYQLPYIRAGFPRQKKKKLKKRKKVSQPQPG